MKSELILMAKHLRSAASYVFMILLFLKTRVNSEGVPAGFPLARFVDLEVKTHQAVDASRTLFHRAPLTPTGCWHVLHLGGGLGSGERCPSPNGTPVLPRGCRTHLFFAVLSVFPTWCHLFLIGFFFFPVFKTLHLFLLWNGRCVLSLYCIWISFEVIRKWAKRRFELVTFVGGFGFSCSGPLGDKHQVLLLCLCEVLQLGQQLSPCSLVLAGGEPKHWPQRTLPKPLQGARAGRWREAGATEIRLSSGHPIFWAHLNVWFHLLILVFLWHFSPWHLGSLLHALKQAQGKAECWWVRSILSSGFAQTNLAISTNCWLHAKRKTIVHHRYSQ